MNHAHRRRWLAHTSMGVGLLIAAVLGGCYPYDRDSTQDYDVIATAFDENADFSSKLTYARPDEVRVLTDPNDDETQDSANLSPQVEQAILAAIDQNMQALGYTLVADPAVADVHMTPFATETTWVGGSCYPYYWDWWYGYPPGYGWCYPTYYTYTTGTVVIPMIDPDRPTNSEPIWIAGINGIISSASSNAARVNSAIDAAFNQSPYLAH